MKSVLEKNYINNLIYAQTIQNGLLPKKRHFEKNFTDFFVYYEPQHKISGDFYWLINKDHKIYFVLGDCTGHGPSAALLSVLGISLLSYVIQKDFENIGDYLTELDKKWIETFNDDNSDTNFDNDWIELTLICYDTEHNTLEYSAAGGEFVVIQNDQVKLCKGNNYPIGGWQIEKDRTFDSYKIDLESETGLYFFSDGIKHQFDGDDRKKFSRKRLLNLLKANHKNTMDEQKNMFEFVFNQWKGESHQTDDVSLIGFKL